MADRQDGVRKRPPISKLLKKVPFWRSRLLDDCLSGTRSMTPSAPVEREHVRLARGYNVRISQRRDQPGRGPNMMIAMPATETAAPRRSHPVGRCPSTSHSHRIATAT
jgi:hypothetical protein